MTNKQSKDPFEVAFESPPDSPISPDENEAQAPAVVITSDGQEDDDVNPNFLPANPSTSTAPLIATGVTAAAGKTKEEEEEEEEENMDVELSKFPSSGDPDKMTKMQAILAQFTEEQMSRYESFRRSGFQKSNMKRLLVSITGSQKISVPMTIVVSGIAKMFVGELVETARVVMTERNDMGPIRPCHIREAYRRLKLEGKVPKRSVSRYLLPVRISYDAVFLLEGFPCSCSSKTTDDHILTFCKIYQPVLHKFCKGLDKLKPL